MSLPVVTLNGDEKWDCHQCGVCCRGSVIPLSDDDIQRLESQKWDKHPQYANTSIMVRQYGMSRSYRLARRTDGSCIFLNEAGRCQIHADFGSEAKPIVCQAFPLQLVSHEKRAVLTIRRACPSAAAEIGRPTETHLPLVKKLVDKGHLVAESSPPPSLKRGESRDWKVIRSVLDAVSRLLCDDRYPPVRRIVHALQFAQNLESAKTRNLSDSQIRVLVETLEELAPEQSKPLFDDRREPRGFSKVMFRLMAVDCARLHPECKHLPQESAQSLLSARLQLIKVTWKAFRGTGKTPAIDACFSSTNFDELEKPLAKVPLDVYRPLERLIESTSVSYLYALANRRDWSVVESIRGLAILFPVGLWMFRWIANERTPNVQDMVNIVVALDRSQGYKPHAGALHRWRLYALSVHSELEKLVIWYAR